MLLRALSIALLYLHAGIALAQSTAIRYLNDWRWEGQAAPLLLALDRGFFDAESLDVSLEPGNGSVNTIPRIASGEFQMGSADINSLITWRDEHPDRDMKAVFIIYNEAPYAVMGRPSQGVTGPLDLEGRVLGAPRFDGAFAQWPAFVVANGIIEERVTIRDVGFPQREAMLASGEVDAITGFSFSSYISLQKNGVPSSDISLMLMSDFGLHLYGNAIIVNPEFAAAHPQAVERFLRALVKGIQETVGNPTAAVEHVLAHAGNADREIELQRLVMAVGHHIDTEEVRAMGLGDVVEARLEKSISQLDAIHDFASKSTARDIFDDRFLPDYSARRLP
ncbi:ABC transporter substrate-binding protein [Granulosicoccus sp. 3-233]|uniref:ABC transporter substrate-binding protein n=1 Tax=Granulosicoccus sp. 3-233 TaxID=3417969 RepID=UPI003D355DDB